MKTLAQLLKRFIPPYKKYIVWNFILNLLSTILSLFSFAAIIPILQILFGVTTSKHSYISWDQADGFTGFFYTLQNNAFYQIEQIIIHSGPASALMWLGLFLIVMTFLKTGATYLASTSLVPVRTGVQRDLRNQIYRKIVSLPIGYFSEERKGDIMSRMTSDVAEIEASIMSSLEIIFKNPLMIIVYVSVLCFLSWQLTLFVMILLPISGYLIGNVGRKLKRSSLQGQEQTGEMLSQIEETLSGLRVVKAFNAEEKLAKRFALLNEHVRKIFTRINRRYLLAHPLGEFLGTMVIACLLWYGGLLIVDGNSSLTAEEFIYYLTIFYLIVPPFKELSKASYSIRKGSASLQRVDDILNAPNPLEQQKSVAKKGFTSDIVFKDVWFQYKKDVWVLKDINLTIKKGQTVALVGQSGSGKSTMVDMLPRFYDVNKGGVLIDGQDIRMINMHDLRELMGNVNQEAILFNDSFYNNITFGVEHATMEEVVAAAKIANAHEFIIATEQGYQSNIGDRGNKLSGGQRQRLSIARAILKNPDILILDEATSALDTESERLVQDAIEKLMRNRTSIVIAHRLSTIKAADLICVMHEGEIVERGNHEELILRNGYYKRLCDMQSF